MIERKYHQRQLGEGFIHDSIDDCWEPWMKIADQILDDEELIEPVYEALRRRRPKSATRGRKGTPAEVALRMLALKHMRNWSFDTLEREVRAYAVWPKSRLELFGHQGVVTKARVAQSSEDGALVVNAQPGYLEIQELIAPSGKKMTGADFMRGYVKKS